MGKRAASEVRVGEVWRRGLALVGASAPATLPVAVFFAVIWAVVERLAVQGGMKPLEASTLASFGQLFVGVLGTVAVTKALLDVAAGGKPSLAVAGRRALRRWGPAVVAGVISNLIISFGLILLVVPGLLAMASYSLVAPLVAGSDLNANQVLKDSKEWTAGQRWRVVAVLLGPVVVSQVVELGVTSLPPQPDPALAWALALGTSLGLSFVELIVLGLQVALFERLRPR